MAVLLFSVYTLETISLKLRLEIISRHARRQGRHVECFGLAEEFRLFLAAVTGGYQLTEHYGRNGGKYSKQYLHNQTKFST